MKALLPDLLWAVKGKGEYVAGGAEGSEDPVMILVGALISRLIRVT